MSSKAFMVAISYKLTDSNIHNKPPRGIPRKRCSENMRQIYRRTPMPKCDFNKVAKQVMNKGCRLWRNLFPAEKSIPKKC